MCQSGKGRRGVGRVNTALRSGLLGHGTWQGRCTHGRFSRCAPSLAFPSGNWLDIVGVCAECVFQRHSFIVLYEEQIVPVALLITQ